MLLKGAVSINTEKNNVQQKEELMAPRYGLFTTITMIVGICIGSGIFFKSDNVLKATGGSVPLGILAFVFGAFSIIFGGLAVSELAARTDKPGGLVTYAEEFVSSRFACAIGWFQTFIYIPGLTCVVSWVVGVYTLQFFGIESNLELEVLIGFIFLTLCFVYNVLAPTIAGHLQNAATVIKLIPLVLVTVFGLVLGNPAEGFKDFQVSEALSGSWLAAVGPIVFSYDGWIISTTISHEVKNSKKNLPRALVIGPIFVLAIYVMYFLGVTSYLGADKVMTLGDSHVFEIFNGWLGDIGAKLLFIFVIISVMGTINGIVLGYIRMPFSLALRGDMLPFSKQLSHVNPKLKMPMQSAILAYVMCVAWLSLHYLTTKFGLLPNSDVSEISIVSSYALYSILYFQVFRLWRAGKVKGALRGVIIPLLAVVGAVLVLVGGMQNPLFVFYAAFCLSFLVIGMIYYNVKHKKTI